MIKCKKCNSENIRIEEKSNNKCAFCNECDSFIKNVPYAEPQFYIGKYKGIKINQCTDKEYMQWFVANVKTTATLKEVLINRIAEL